MSYWVSLQNDRGEIPEVDSFEEGGTYAMGGSTEADLSVTYNYSKLFSVKNELHGKYAYETIPILEAAVKRFGTEKSADYWEPTEGNVGAMCHVLIGWARQYPSLRWNVN